MASGRKQRLRGASGGASKESVDLGGGGFSGRQAATAAISLFSLREMGLKRIQQYRRSRGDARVAEIRSPLDEKPNEDNDPVYGVLDERETQTTLGPAWNAISRRSAASARLEILIGE